MLITLLYRSMLCISESSCCLLERVIMSVGRSEVDCLASKSSVQEQGTLEPHDVSAQIARGSRLQTLMSVCDDFTDTFVLRWTVCTSPRCSAVRWMRYVIPVDRTVSNSGINILLPDIMCNTDKPLVG